ncbi:MAG: hypothetical protein ABI629_15445 [bacterium]
MPTRIAAAAVATLAALLYGAVPARATVVVAKDFAALCAEADLVFVGTVSATAAEWSDPEHRDIRTRVTFADLTWLRGDGAAAVTLRFAGGALDGLREEIAGVPHFAVGERRIIFARAGAYISPLVGFTQGMFQVVDGADGEVVLDAGGRAVTGVGSAAVRRGDVGDVQTALPLDAFLGRVRSQMEAR